MEALVLISLGKQKEAQRFFDPEYKTHNPYTPGDINELTAPRVLVFLTVSLKCSQRNYARSIGK